MIRMIEWAFSDDVRMRLIRFAVALVLLGAGVLTFYLVRSDHFWFIPFLIWIVPPIAIIAAAYKRRGE